MHLTRKRRRSSRPCSRRVESRRKNWSGNHSTAEGDSMIFNRSRLVFGLVVLAFIVVTEFVAAYLKVPAWPAYIAWVLFFIEGMNPKKVPSILVGAAVGIGLILMAPYAIGFFAQWLGLN